MPSSASAPLPLAPPATARLPFLTVVSLTFLVMLPVCFNRFVLWDDPYTVACNAQLAPMTGKSLRFWWTGPVLGLYAPLTYTTWGLLSLVARVPTDPATGISQNPAVFHAASLLVHVIATAIVFRILLLLIDRPWPAAAAAILFGIHPLQVETVAWVSAFNGDLSTMLGLAALWQYLRVARDPSRHRGRTIRYALATALLLLALLAKPSAVVIPTIAATIDRMLLRRRWRQVAAAVVPWLALAGAFAVLAARSQPPPKFNVMYPWAERPLVAADAVTFYLGKTLVPWRLGIVYARTPTRVLNSPWVYYTWLIPLAAALLLWRSRASARGVAAGAIVFILGMAPVLGFVQFLFQFLHSTVADRYAYLPMFGVAVALAWSLARIDWSPPPRRRAARALGSLAAIALIALTEPQIRTWRDSQSLFRQAQLVHPRPWQPPRPGLIWAPRHDEPRTLNGELVK